MNKKFKKITASLILAIYLFVACFPFGVLAETKINKLNYAYTMWNDLKSEYATEGLKFIYNDFMNTLFEEYAAYDYIQRPDVYNKDLKAKYPDKASSFNEYNPNYASDYLDLFLHYGLENPKLLIGQPQEVEIDDDVFMKIFVPGPLSHLVFDEADDDETDEFKDNFEDNKKELTEKYFKNFFKEFIEAEGITIDNIEEIYGYDTMVEVYYLAYKYNNGKLLEEYTIDDIYNYMYLEAIEDYVDDTDYDAFGQFDVRASIDGLYNPFGTTYYNGGYNTHLEINGEKVILGFTYPYPYEELDTLLYTKVDSNGIHYNKPNYAKLDISLKNTNDTTVVATYTLKNTQNKEVSFKLGSASDLQMGNNDKAAITKINNGFRITQDELFGTGYAAQVNIVNSPTPKTTYVGPYASSDGYSSSSFYYEHVFENSSKSYYTKADSIDTALGYSWDGTLAAGETKTFTTTFSINVAEDINITYHNIDKTTSVKTALGGGAFQTIEGSMVPEKGYHSEWNTKSDGSGTYYEIGQWIIAPNEDMDLYEVKVKNSVIGYEEPEAGDFLGGKIINAEILSEMLKEEAENSYNNVKIVLDINDSRYSIEDETKELINESLTKDFKVLSYFDADVYKLVYNSPDYYDKDQLSELNKKLKISLTLPKSYINTDNTVDRTYELIRIHNDKAEVIDCEFDATTGELIFESDKFSTFAIAYKDTAKPQEVIPDTLDKIIYSFAGITLAIGTIAAVYFINKKKNIRN